tara:strand:- start:223678 stop:223953 length:276 start_codon:yes stop_codon:yes gene_type:complete
VELLLSITVTSVKYSYETQATEEINGPEIEAKIFKKWAADIRENELMQGGIFQAVLQDNPDFLEALSSIGAQSDTTVQRRIGRWKKENDRS